MGPAGAPFEDHVIRCGRPDGYRHPHPDAVHRDRLGARRPRADRQEPDPGSRTHRHDADRHDVDRQEVNGSQVREARGRREEGRGDPEAEDRPCPQGHSPHVHRQEVDGSAVHGQEVDGSQVHEARGRREEGGRHAEAEDCSGSEGIPENYGPQIHGKEVDRSQVHEARRRREEGGRNQEAEDSRGSQVHVSQVHRQEVREARDRREEGGSDEEAQDGGGPQGYSSQGHSPQVDGTTVSRAAVHGEEVDGSQVHEACGRRQEGRCDEEAEDGGGTPCPQSEHTLRDGSGADPVGDSPGEPFEIPDDPVAVEEPGTTAEEQGDRSLERRLAMDEPDASPTDPPTAEGTRPHPILDDDVATEDAITEDTDGPVDEADLDRSREEVGELSSDPAESAEESAMHIERE
ncbi:MAG: hypothetical protein K0R20_1973 [Actinomycetia bacterium]|nr:hypothetical protein [Actinomycetes bacterium]